MKKLTYHNETKKETLRTVHFIANAFPEYSTKAMIEMLRESIDYLQARFYSKYRADDVSIKDLNLQA